MRNTNQGTRFLRVRDICEKLSIGSRTTLYRYEREGILPARRQLGPGIVGWVEAEVDEWLSTRPRVTRTQGSEAA